MWEGNLVMVTCPIDMFSTATVEDFPRLIATHRPRLIG